MGLDIMFAVERRGPDGVWRRAEPLIPNPYLELFQNDPFPTLHGAFIHDDWSFYPRNQWLIEMDWPGRSPLPADISQETREFLDAWTDADLPRHHLLLQDLEVTDWLSAWNGVNDLRWQERPDERDRYLMDIRAEVLAKVRPLGAPEQVRLIWGSNV